ncbi:MAG: hypothetical protein ACK502_03710 [Alphaproteobacteria bacterium]
MFDTVSFESYLQRRFRHSMGDGSEVVFESSNDVGLLHQYRLLQDNMLINMSGARVPAVRIAEDKIHIVAHRGRHCLGGLQIALKEPESKGFLPVERGGLNISALLKHLPVSSVRSAQISDIAVFPDNADEITEGLLQEALAELITAKVRFVFIVAPAGKARAYGTLASQAGFVTSFIKSSEIGNLDADSDVIQGLLVMDLAPAYKNKNNDKQYVINKEHIVYEN